MSKYKVCVYTICKNEEKFVDRWVDSMKEADLIVVCDTGSTDDTVHKLKARGVIVYNINIDPWRFDAARNVSLDFVPKDIDICVCTDLDEVFEEGWREKIERAWTPETTRLRCMFTSWFKKDGSRGATYWYDKIHHRKGYRWIRPVHETPVYYDDEKECITNAFDVQLNHFPDTSKSRGQYLSLLELSKKENPHDNNTVFWLGREYMYNRQYDDCICTLKEHLLLPTATWDEERSASMRYIARCYLAKDNHMEAKKWIYRAIAECPTIREPYVEMVRLGYSQKDWSLIYAMVEAAFQIKEKHISYLAEESSWDRTLYDFGAIACYRLQMYDKAYMWGSIAYELSPDDERLKKNLLLMKEKISAEKKGK